MPSRISLETPSEKYGESFFEAMAEFEREGIPQVSADLTREEFPAYVQRLHDLAAGRNLKEGYIPSLEFWMVDADGYAGRIILGLAFTPNADRVGNHVGYAVRPSKRLQGYATEALGFLLSEARMRGIACLMPICDSDNLGSQKVIERNGGVLWMRTPNEDGSTDSLRYVIDLT